MRNININLLTIIIIIIIIIDVLLACHAIFPPQREERLRDEPTERLLGMGRLPLTQMFFGSRHHARLPTWECVT